MHVIIDNDYEDYGRSMMKVYDLLGKLAKYLDGRPDYKNLTATQVVEKNRSQQTLIEDCDEYVDISRIIGEAFMIVSVMQLKLYNADVEFSQQVQDYPHLTEMLEEFETMYTLIYGKK